MQRKAFEFFNTSYADLYKKTQKTYIKFGLAHSRSRRYGYAMPFLTRSAYYKPNSVEGRKAIAAIVKIEKEYSLILDKAEKATSKKLQGAAKSALKTGIKKFKGWWHAHALAKRLEALTRR